MNWVQGIDRALGYIEAHLDEEIDMAVLAKEACSSPYHFQRVFGLLCGCTLGEYIRQRRLSRAGEELAAGMRVIDAAVKYGYESPDSFARAFVRFHGVKPSQARERGIRLRTLMPLSVTLVLEGGNSMQFRMEQFPGKTLLGFTRRFEGVPHGEKRARQEEEVFTTTRAKQWMLRGIAGSCPIGDPMYTCVVSHVDDDGYDFSIAVETDAWEREHLMDETVTGIDFMPSFGFEEIVVPAGTYAVFETERTAFPIERFHDLREQIASQWLPGSGYVLVDRPEMEIIHWLRKPRKQERYVELWLPVEQDM